jgi:subtilisin family serine protease
LNALKRLAGTFFLALLMGLISFSAQVQSQDKLSIRLRNSIAEQGEESLFTAWIFLVDKGPNPTRRLAAVEASLKARALIRRLRHRGPENLVDTYDIPVYEPYVEQLRAYVHRIRHRSRWLNAVSLEARGQDLIELAALPFVLRLKAVAISTWRDPVVEPMIQAQKPIFSLEDHRLDYGDSLAQLELMRVPDLHDQGFSGKGVLICMLDSGFNALDHQALDHLDIVATWDFVNNDPLVGDETGQMGTGNHGTSTLGALAGFYPGELIGPAYNASFLLGKTENTDWERHVEEDHWVAGAEWADEWGADIISSSLGYRYDFSHGEADYSGEEMDGETAVVTRGANIAAARGILIVNSAGNEREIEFPLSTLNAPSDSPLVLAAGAVNSAGRRVNFSSVGPTADGRIKPDVMAQGAAVRSAVSSALDAYGWVQGTSFSCPLTAGVAALVMEAHPTWTNLEIMQALKSTASQADQPDNRMGWGVVDAVDAAAFSPTAFYPPAAFGVHRLENNYIFFIQYIDRLHWQKNPRNQTQVVKYRLYARPAVERLQEYKLLVEFDSATFSYDNRGLLGDEAYNYKIAAVDVEGNESPGAYTVSK